MCRNFLSPQGCKYGAKCTFAHSQQEIKRPKMGPCWYFNHGGCTKSASACTFNHVIDKNMRKPLNLQHPCIYYHLRTPGVCTKQETCKGDHDYVLNDDEWNHHFPNDQRPREDECEEDEIEEEESYGTINGFKCPTPPRSPVLPEIVVPKPPIEKEVKEHVMKPSKPSFLSSNWADDDNDDELFEKLKAYVSAPLASKVEKIKVRVVDSFMG